MATVVNFIVDAGTLFEGIANIQHEDGTAFDLTGLDVYGRMKRSYYTNTGIDIDCSVEGDPTLGQIKLVLLPTATENIKPSKYVYDVKVIDPNNTEYRKRVLQGTITISPQVTRIL